MAVVFSNNAATTLASNLTSSATSIVVTDGSVFPALSGSDYTYLTLEAPLTDTREVVKLTARSGNTLTVVRAQDSSSASAFSAGDKCELRITAALLNDLNTEADTESVSRAGDSMTGNLSLGDNNKVIFGAGSDLQIYHSGAASYISDTGDGSLLLTGNGGDISFWDAANSAYMVRANTGGDVQISHAGTVRLATTSTGIDVTGTITADGLDLGDNSILNVGTIAADQIKGDADDNTNITFAGSDITRFYQGGSNIFSVLPSGVDVTGDIKLTDASPLISLFDTSVTNLEHQIISSSDNLLFHADVNDVDSGNRAEVLVSSVSSVRFNKGSTVFNEGSADIDFRVESDGVTHAFFVDASTDKIGIGESAPATYLDIGFTSLDQTDGIQIHNKQFGGYGGAVEWISRTAASLSGGSDRIAGQIQVAGANNWASDSNVESTMKFSLVEDNTLRNILELNPSSEVVINQDSIDMDFRVESDSNAHALFVDGGTGNVLMSTSTIAYAGTALNIGDTSDSQNGVQITTSTTGHGYILFGDGSNADSYRGQIHYQHSDDSLKFNTAGTVRAKFSSSEIVLNDVSADTDFRVESNSNTHMLFLDAGANKVGINRSDPDAILSIRKGGLSKSWTPDSNDIVTIENNASAALDIRVPNSSQSLILFSDSAARAQGVVGYAHGNERFYISQNGSEQLRIESGSTVFNELSLDQDFRVESDTNSHMLFMDAVNNRVNIGTTDVSSQGTLAVNGSAIFGRSSTTTGDLFSSGGGNSGAYNGIAILSNSDGLTAQANTSLSSWIVDIGGRAADGVTFPVDTADSFVVRRVAAGGTYYGSANYFHISGGSTVINEDSNDHDFRVETDATSHAFVVNAGNDAVEVGAQNAILAASGHTFNYTGLTVRNTGTATSSSHKSQILFDVYGSGGNATRASIVAGKTDSGSTNGFLRFDVLDAGTVETRLSLRPDEVVVNDESYNVDFRVESDANANAFFIEASSSKVNMGTGTAANAHLNIDGTIHGGYGSFIRLNNAGTDGVCGFIGATDNNWSIGSGKVIIGRAPQDNGPSSSYADIAIGLSDLVINENSYDKDFRVESDGNTHALFLDAGAVTGGRVGIKTSTPDHSLSVQGAASFYMDAAPFYNIKATDYSTTATGLFLCSVRGGSFQGVGTAYYYNSGYFRAQQTDATALNFYNGKFTFYADTVTVDTDYLPTTIAEIGPTETVFNQNSADADFRVESDVNSHMLFINAGTNKIGINSSNPQTILEIVDSNPKLRLEDSASGSKRIDIGVTSGAVAFVDAPQSAQTLKNSISGTESLTQYHNTSGVVVNEGGADRDFRVESNSNTHALFVDAGVDATFFGKTNNGVANSGAIIRAAGELFVTRAGDVANFNRLSTPGALLYFRQDGVVVGSVDTSSTGATYNTTSDRRLKKDIETITDGTDKLMAMNPVKHGWKADPEADAVHGFIAQEMMDIVPEAVSGDPEGEEMMSMDYGRITPVLVAALQDAHKKIAELETRLNELEGK